MPRRILPTILLLLTVIPLHGQVRGILGFPDRVMSSSRIGSVSSSRDYLVLPQVDTGRMVFPAGGDRSVSEDYGFFSYLVDNELKQDARTLVSGRYSPSDTLDFMRAKVLFYDRKLSQAEEYFGRVPYASPFGTESFFYRVVSLSTLKEYDRAARLLSSGDLPADCREGGPYAELASFQEAGLALLRERKEDWIHCSRAFTQQDFTLAEGERILSGIGEERFFARQKHAGVAALASAIVPGAGKVYSGRLGEGVAAFLTVGSLGAVTAENWKKHGAKDWRTIVAGTVCATFYLGNIYGSYMSISIEKQERADAQDALILYHLHLPLRSTFR